MDMRRIAVVGSFATGAALALAPLASATPVDPLISVVDSEIAQQNSIFEFEALLAGDSGDITKGGVGVYDTFTTPADLLKDAPDLDNAADASKVTPLEYEVYGVNPIAAGISDSTGPFNVFNGALTEFYDAYNVELYSLLNPTLAIDTIPSADLLGSSETITDAFTNGTGSVSDVATYFFEFGANDLAGYLDLPAFFPSLIP
ncbi:MAG: hypothetical protein QOI30_49 [Mycobacterium sp.]|jgi:hypothetical protein|nr:hypothetical protein [Mycobacterium sp.]